MLKVDSAPGQCRWLMNMMSSHAIHEVGVLAKVTLRTQASSSRCLRLSRGTLKGSIDEKSMVSGRPFGNAGFEGTFK
ncbi:hypothetical protein HZH66_001638 [Vespula vulgaris]|uniref:Uncharacterized protein n=1 Tax=Vespula vulgaris TaxID=7454 RepID=A0A834NKG7_VESVU|nr:hypothetical protein HZH66_001638 [Vespula vulgaris]